MNFEWAPEDPEDFEEVAKNRVSSMIKESGMKKAFLKKITRAYTNEIEGYL